MSAESFRWGIIGLGRIAHQFARGLQSLPSANLAAVASRTKEKADDFGREFNVERCYGSYQELYDDPYIDAVYVATPHPMHYENTLACLKHKKPVLCEKPLAINSIQAKELVHTANTENVFLMEAMWTLFFPLIIKMQQMISDGVIGDARMLKGDFGFDSEVDPTHRTMNPELGGGSLLDVGIYVVTLSYMLFGVPQTIYSHADIGNTGVDEVAAMLFAYHEGQMSLISSAVKLRMDLDVTIYGTKGRIKIHTPWWKPQRMSLIIGDEEQIIDVPYEGNGYNYEAMEVEKCVRAKQIESKIVPHNETIAIMTILDSIRSDWGLRYPME